MYVSMDGMLRRANEKGYAVMAINCFNMETARTVITAAENRQAPIIINVFQGHLQHAGSKLMAQAVSALADCAKVPVALNLDHGQDLLTIRKVIEDGFSSVMIDAADDELEDNIQKTQCVVEYAHKRGIAVEGEVGCMGETAGGCYTEDSRYTNIGDAIRFADETGVDAMAISYGSSHGLYPDGTYPKFDFDRVRHIKEATQLPLVLHGGSGSGDGNIRQSVACGINKINVGCDFMKGNVRSIANTLATVPDILYCELLDRAEQESRSVVEHYIELSGSAGQISYQ